jgi:hypothetical protein
MSLLGICQDAARDLHVAIPSAVVASSDPQALLLLRLANDEGRSLAGRHHWQNLQSEHSFLTVAAAAQVNAIPADFDRIIPDTMFNRTSRRQVYGPIDATEWQRQQASLITAVNPAFRIRGNAILIAPLPRPGDTIAYEYISRHWCESNAGSPHAEWLADTDRGRLDEALMTLGVIWRFRRDKGFAFDDEKDAYERRVADAIMNDGTRRRIGTTQVGYGGVPRPAAPDVPETLIFP